MIAISRQQKKEAPPELILLPHSSELQVSERINHLRTRQDLRTLALNLWNPLLAISSTSNALCHPGTTGAVYDNGAAGMEGFCRPLWGVLACAAQGDYLPGTELLPVAIAAGVDPKHVDFWGHFVDDDQRCVEMAVLAWGLTAAPAAFWEKLDNTEQMNLVAWLDQINRVETLPANNWRFFRILVNLGLRSVNQPYCDKCLQQDLELMESCYLGDGWYSDGRGSQRDYYVAMAMHYYGLLIARHDPPDLAEYTSRYRKRARLFASQFIEWFVPEGSALPYGRSLIYRFAQSAFWSALAWANEEALPWGVIKGLLLRNLRSWLSCPILDSGGVLSIGYKYPNLNMAEGYNSPASPYWAMKALLVLGLPENHPFWEAKEAPLPELPVNSIQTHPGFVIRRHDNQQDITVLASGQFPNGWHVRHAAAKYAKFTYGTRFGFSVSVGPVTLEDGAYDNMLALSDDGHHWRVREKCSTVRMEDDILISTWFLWPDVRVCTWLLFDADWQVRFHLLDSKRQLMSAEAGHAVPRPEMSQIDEENCRMAGLGNASVIFPDNAAGLVDPRGLRDGTIVVPTPNSNLLYPRTILPVLRGIHAPGVHWLVTFLPITYNPIHYSQLLEPSVELSIQSNLINVHLPSGRRLKLFTPLSA